MALPEIDSTAANGALGLLAMGQMQVTRGVIRAMHEDSRFNRLLALNAVRACRESLDELEAALAVAQDEAEAA